MAFEIPEYYISDFSQWDSNHHAYKDEFDKLLRGLSIDGKLT